MSLPEPWVEKIFRKLMATYGQAFLRQYDGVELTDVKANWAEEMSGFQQCPTAISYGLANLPPDRAPTVLQFRDLCRREPSRTQALPAPQAEPVSPDVVRATRAAFKRPGPKSHRSWAFALRDREARGEKLTKFQRDCWRDSVGVWESEAEGV